MACMLRGNLAGAWEESDRVLAWRKLAGIDCRNEPLHCQFLWDGSAFAGKRVLMRCYHGLGDTIQFVRYVPRLKRIAARVIVQAQPELIPLLRSMSEIDELVALGAEVPAFDVEIESMELPHAFRTELGTIPAAVPYLGAPVLPSRNRQGEVLRVGLVWTAGAWKPERSIPLPDLLAVNKIPNISLYSLQRGPAMEQTSIPDIGSDDILETAAALDRLDLVITVDTMIPHLAGALGKRVWTLLHFHSDWRWMIDREDSPWYPTMRLLRQAAAGDWKSVVQRVASELRRL